MESETIELGSDIGASSVCLEGEIRLSSESIISLLTLSSSTVIFEIEEVKPGGGGGVSPGGGGGVSPGGGVKPGGGGGVSP